MPPSDNFSLGHILRVEKGGGWREMQRKRMRRRESFSMNSITGPACGVTILDLCQLPKLPPLRFTNLSGMVGEALRGLNLAPPRPDSGPGPAGTGHPSTHPFDH